MSKPKEWVWYQEYKTCSCTFVGKERQELPGHCPRHQTETRRTVKLPRGSKWKDEDLGYVET